MRDLIVFEIDKNLYGLNLEFIQRIIQVPDMTKIPDTHPYIDGMMSYEDRVIKVLDFRKMIRMPAYAEKLKKHFTELKGDHKEWVDALTTAVVDDVPFDKTTDPHACRLGKWLDGFNSYDNEVSTVFRKLYSEHAQLHKSAIGLLDLRKVDEDAALKSLQTDIMGTYSTTMDCMDEFVNHFDKVASSMQKLLIYNDNNKLFGIKVDAIADISSIDDSKMRPMDDIELDSDCIEIDGVIEHDEKLVNIIRAVRLPRNEVA